ncbi:hypothetical protein VPH35_062850 [Triticum aestivum]
MHLPPPRSCAATLSLPLFVSLCALGLVHSSETMRTYSELQVHGWIQRNSTFFGCVHCRHKINLFLCPLGLSKSINQDESIQASRRLTDYSAEEIQAPKIKRSRFRPALVEQSTAHTSINTGIINNNKRDLQQENDFSFTVRSNSAEIEIILPPNTHQSENSDTNQTPTTTEPLACLQSRRSWSRLPPPHRHDARSGQ